MVRIHRILPGPKMTTSWTGVLKVVREAMKDGKHRELLATGKTGMDNSEFAPIDTSIKKLLLNYSAHELMNL